MTDVCSTTSFTELEETSEDRVVPLPCSGGVREHIACDCQVVFWICNWETCSSIQPSLHEKKINNKVFSCVQKKLLASYPFGEKAIMNSNLENTVLGSDILLSAWLV